MKDELDFFCGHCGHRIKADPEKNKGRMKCPACKEPIRFERHNQGQVVVVVNVAIPFSRQVVIASGWVLAALPGMVGAFFILLGLWFFVSAILP